MKKLLENDHIRLRPVEPDDADFMWSVESDSLQWIQNSLVAPFSRENLLNYARTYEADPFTAEQLRLIITDMSGRRIGIADLYDLSAQHHTSFVGVYILPEYRRMGIAMEALSILEDYARRVLNLRQLAAKIVDGNEMSMQLFLKAGYEWSGTLKNWIQSGSQTFSLHYLQKQLLG